MQTDWMDETDAILGWEGDHAHVFPDLWLKNAKNDDLRSGHRDDRKVRVCVCASSWRL